ncbi:MAG: hypothetical protein WC312_07295 [Candidatus Omnitrophota bacterium]|jgi:uncharacterized membrane protein YphA (DoxX/SURF4 family)
MSRQNKKRISCQVPGCNWQGHNLALHIKVKHPDYKPEGNSYVSEAPQTPAPPAGTPDTEAPGTQTASLPLPAADRAELPEEIKPQKIEQETNKRSYKKIVPAVFIMIAGAAILILGRANPFAIIFGAGIIAGGIFLFKSGWNEGSVRIISSKGGKQVGGLIVGPSGEPPNTLVLHAGCPADGEPNWFAYQYVEKPLGQRVKRRNDGTWWYVMREKSTADKTLIAHSLPDNSDAEIYCDPEVMGNALSLPATKRLFSFNNDSLQKVSLIVMGVIVAGEIIGLIALTGETETAAIILNQMNLV